MKYVYTKKYHPSKCGKYYTSIDLYKAVTMNLEKKNPLIGPKTKLTFSSIFFLFHFEHLHLAQVQQTMFASAD